MPAEDPYCLLTASVCPFGTEPRFYTMYGRFSGGKFVPDSVSEPDKGPDQYAGQVFRDHLGRNIMITWIPGWRYSGYAANDIGVMSVPRELKLTAGKITAFPVKEVQHLLRTDDPSVRLTDTGFVIERQNREPVIYEGRLTDLKILRDNYIAEIFVNNGETVYTVLL